MGRVWSISLDPNLNVEEIYHKAEQLLMVHQEQKDSYDSQESQEEYEEGEEEEGEFEEGTEMSEDPSKRKVIVSVLNTEEC